MNQTPPKTFGFPLPAITILVAAGLLFSVAAQARSAELVMFESAGCGWCETWHEEVGVVFDKTEEARDLKLRIVDTDSPVPADLNGIRPASYTPTFVVLDDGREVGRILGYPGEDFFWGLLHGIMEKLPKRTVSGL